MFNNARQDQSVKMATYLIHHQHLDSVHFGQTFSDKVQDPAWSGYHNVDWRKRGWQLEDWGVETEK